MEYPALVNALVSVSPEVIALRLDQVSRQVGRAQAVNISQRRHECRHRQAQPGSNLYHAMQVIQAGGYRLTQRLIEQEVEKIRGVVVGITDWLEAPGAG